MLASRSAPTVHTGEVKYRLIIFDFDGTLADSFSVFEEAFALAVPRFGLRQLDMAELQALRRCSARQVIDRLGLPLWKVPAMGAFVRGLMAERLDAVRLFPGIAEMLSDLAAAGVTVAIVSSNSEKNIRRILGPDVAPLIRAYECGASLFGKAAKFRQVLKKAGFAAAHALSVGDEIRDIEASRNVGLDFAAVTWGYTSREGLEEHAPVALFDKPAEIVPWLI